MNKEPIGLYVFRFVMGMGLFFLMCMLYWSSLLLEKDLKELKNDVQKLEEEVDATRLETKSIHHDVLEAILEDQKNRQELLKGIYHNNAEIQLLKRDGTASIKSGKAKNRDLKLSFKESSPLYRGRSHIDHSLPNLLTKDLFYRETLPTLLDKNFRPKGTYRTASIGKPENLHPFNGFRSVSNMIGLCTLSVANREFGKFETMSPGMAIKVEERKNSATAAPEYWVHLRDEVYWQPLQKKLFPDDMELAQHFLHKHQVTSEDFKFYFDAIMNPSVQLPAAASLRNYLGDIVEFHIVDKLTFFVRWKSEKVISEGEVKEMVKYSAKGLTGSLQPLARFVYQYFPDGTKIVEDDSDPTTYATHSVWAQNFTEHWAKNIIPSCGPWIFEGISDQNALFRRNPDHFNPLAALKEKQEIIFKESVETMWQDFKAGKIDTYNINPDQLIELENFLASEEYQKQKGEELSIQRTDYITRSYNYVGWNQATPYFSSAKVRRAMTLAIDRERIIKQNLNGMGTEISGPFFRYSPSNDSSIEPWPFDPDEARQLLEEEGWYDSDGDGIRNKEIDGKNVPFSFSLTYFVKNPNTKINCEYIATALNEIGVKCHLKGVDIADLSNAFDEKSFDALYLGWALGSPPEEPKQLWHSSGAKEKGSSNAVGFSNEEADKIIEKLQYEYDIEKRNALYHRFHAIIHEEAPYTFLYTPNTALLHREYVQNVFIPAHRQDLIPGANVPEPSPSVFWLKARAER